MSELEFEKGIFRGLKDAQKMAVEVALKTGTTLVTWEKGKVKEVKPTKRMLESL